MEWLNFEANPLGANLAVFTVCTVVVWLAGWRLSQYADRFASVIGISNATVGMVLLAGMTSLPELAVTLSAAVAETPQLAINNLLGSIAMLFAVLAVADALIGREALTVIVGNATVLLQATLNTLLLVLCALAVAVGDVPFLGAGAWTWSLLAAYGVAIWIVAQSGERRLWVPRHGPVQVEAGVQEPLARLTGQAAPPSGDEPLRPLVLRLVVGGAAILVAGFILSRSGEAIADQTGLGSSFVGAVFIAVASSLPEVSSVSSSVRRRRYEMALADIFGTNLFNVLLVFVTDLAWRGGPVLNEVGRFSLVASLLGALLAGIYLVGLLERRDKTIARMGVDSFLVLLLYAGGLVLLYRLR